MATDLVPFKTSSSGVITPEVKAPRGNVLATLAAVGPTAAGLATAAATGSVTAAIAGALIGAVAMFSPKIANQWERAVVLKFGRYVGMRGPGVFWVIPGVHTVAAWVDQRTVTTPFAAEQTLTSDAVPVNVDAVLFWTVYDPEKAALEVQDYRQAVSWAAQTALRDIIGRTSLTELLRGRLHIEKELQALIDERTTPWGVTVHSVEMRDVVIPASLQDAMSREAQAAREKQARIILGEAEVEIAKLFEKAAESYSSNPTALQLRQMNILYEGLKQKGGMMVVPSTMVESMGPAGVMAAAAMAQQQQQQQQAARPALAAGNGQPEDDTALRVVPDLPVFGGEG
jgi:regulator of protease activity HflC (stomatin/prohibitin superfamily)